jgi:hypothetical protein
MTTTTPMKPAISDGTSSPWTRIAGICGILTALLWFGMGAAIASGSPQLGDSAEEIRTWMQDDQDKVAFFTIGMGVTLMLLMVFGAGLRSHLARVDRTGYMPSVFFGALVAQVGGGLVGLSYWAVLSHDVAKGLSDDVILTLSALDNMVFFGLLPLTSGLMLIAASIVLLQSRIMPTWLAGFGLVCGIATAISTLWVFSGDLESFLAQGPGFIGFLGTLIWFAIVGGYLVRGDKA